MQHHRNTSRRRTQLAAAALAVVVIAALAALLWHPTPAGRPHPVRSTAPGLIGRTPAASASATPSPAAPSPTADTGPRPAALATPPITLTVPGGWVSWAYTNQTGLLTGSRNSDTETTTAEQLVATWIAADHLRTTPTTVESRAQLSAVLRTGDRAVADTLYTAAGGTAVLTRMVDLCGLTTTRPDPGDWAQTTLTAIDAARLGACLANGTAAGGVWTPWLLNELRQPAGEARFGPIMANPGDGYAITNGWALRPDGLWHVNCVTIGPGWILTTLLRYPASRGMKAGGDLCTAAARQLALT